MSNHVRKYLDLSTGHLTEFDNGTLRSVDPNADAPLVRPYEYGYWVWVPDREDLEVYLTAYTEYGFSSAFCTVLRYARENACDWINFDRDAEPCPDLVTFKW